MSQHKQIESNFILGALSATVFGMIGFSHWRNRNTPEAIKSPEISIAEINSSPKEHIGELCRISGKISFNGKRATPSFETLPGHNSFNYDYLYQVTDKNGNLLDIVSPRRLNLAHNNSTYFVRLHSETDIGSSNTPDSKRINYYGELIKVLNPDTKKWDVANQIQAPELQQP